MSPTTRLYELVRVVRHQGLMATSLDSRNKEDGERVSHLQRSRDNKEMSWPIGRLTAYTYAYTQAPTANNHRGKV